MDKFSVEELMPVEFKSGNSVDIERATIKKDRMKEIIQNILDMVSERS